MVLYGSASINEAFLSLEGMATTNLEAHAQRVLDDH